MNGPVCDYYIGDDMKLRQVMINILGNAVKFTPSGGTVTFVVESVARFNGKSTLRFIISDTDIGMSQEFLPKLFDAFSQEDSSKASRYGSTGLGMAITNDEDVQHSMQAGLNAHLCKPVEPDVLFKTLESLLHD